MNTAPLKPLLPLLGMVTAFSLTPLQASVDLNNGLTIRTVCAWAADKKNDDKKNDDKKNDDKKNDDKKNDDKKNDDKKNDDKKNDDKKNDDKKNDDKKNDDKKNDDKKNDDKKNDDKGRKGKAVLDDHARDDRTEITLRLDPEILAKILAGDVVLVDNLGRVIELDIKDRESKDVVVGKPRASVARKRPGSIETVKTVTLGEVAPGRELVVDQGRLFEVRTGADGKDATTLPTVPVVSDLIQVGRDLSPAAEADLIAKGWR